MKKIGPTRFEMRESDFIPNRNLHVLILEQLAEADITAGERTTSQPSPNTARRGVITQRPAC